MSRCRSVAAAAALAIVSATAAGQTWTGGGGTNLWSASANWTSAPGATPATLTFTGAPPQASSINDAVTTVGTIRFPTTTAAFVLAGTSTVAVTGSIHTVNVGTGTTQEISFPIQLGSSTSGATVQVNVGGNGHFLRLSGLITGGTASELRKVVDNGRLILTANNTFVGKAAFRVGEVQFPRWGNLGDPSPLGAGNLPIEVGQAGNTTTMIYDGSGESTNRYIQVGMGASGLGGATITSNGSGPLLFTAAGRPSHPTYGNDLFNQRQPGISAGIDRVLTFQGSNTGSNTVASVIVDNLDGSSRVGVTKAGSGRWILSGTNTYTGGTQVNAGTLVLDGLTGISFYTNQVQPNAILAGSGTLRGPTTVSGILSPGGEGGSIGALSFVSGTAGNFLWSSGSTAAAATDWRFDLGPGDSSDLVSIAGAFVKSGTGSGFRFDFGSSASLGTFTLATWTGTTNFSAGDFSFTNLGGGNTGTFDILGSSLVFTAVPEPTTAVGLVASVLWAGIVARRRRSAG